MSLTSMTGSCRLLCYRTPVEVEWLSVTREIQEICYYMFITWKISKLWKEKWWPGRDMVWVLVSVRSCVAVDTGHSLVTLFFLSVSVKDRPLHWTLGKSQTYYPEHILGYGRRKDLLLSCHGFRLFPDWLSGGFWVKRSLHSTESRTQRQGLRVPVWTRT